MNLTGRLRTPHFPYECYPDHWGPFPFHEIFPMSASDRALEVQYYQICVEIPNPESTIYLGFDDFAPGWPAERELSRDARKRQETIRAMAQFRALVQVKKVKELSLEGVERLRAQGADVSEQACKLGLWVAVHGVYRNLPVYRPDERDPSKIRVQFIHEFDGYTAERILQIRSMDKRTFARCMLYIERIKLKTFMFNTSKEDGLRTPVEQRDIEWFIKRLITEHQFNTAHLPDKQDNYRGARRHTSEARHTFVCHAEWMLEYATLHTGVDRVISKTALKRWAEATPAMRELAVQDGRAGWGVWDYVWDKVDPLAWYHREHSRLRHYLNRVRREAELENEGDHDADMESDSGGRSYSRLKGKGRSVSSSKGRHLDKGKGRANTDERNYMHTWIQQPSSDDEASLDDEPMDRFKRARVGRGSSPSLGGWERWSSPSLGGYRGGDGPQSSQSLGGWQSTQGTSSAGAGSSRARGTGASPSSKSGPSKPTGLSGWSVPGLGRSVSGVVARSSVINASAGPSNQSRLADPHTTQESSAQFTESGRGASSRRATSSGVESRSLETRLSRLATTAAPPEYIVLSSDDDEMAPPGPPVKLETQPGRPSTSTDSHSVIEILDTTSEEDTPMGAIIDSDDIQEDDAGSDSNRDKVVDGETEVLFSPPPSRRRSTVVSETPGPSRTRQSSRQPSHPLTTMSEEEISDSQESRNSSDSETKYGPRVRRVSLTPADVERRKIQELNKRIHAFAPNVLKFPDPPMDWSVWRCTYPPLTLPLSSVALARKHKCSFIINILNPSEAMFQLLSASTDPTDAEFLKHLETRPSVFASARDELPRGIFDRLVELHWELHYKTWGVKMIDREGGSDAPGWAHFEPL